MGKELNSTELHLKIKVLQNEIKKLKAENKSPSKASGNSTKKDLPYDININYQLLFENMHEGFLHAEIICKNKKPVDFRVLYTNKAFENHIGLKPKQVIGKLISEVLPGVLSENANWLKVFGNVALYGKTVSVTDYSSSQKRWFSTNIFQPQKKQFAVTFIDITKRKLHEKNLEASEYLFRSLIKQAPDAVYLSDMNGNIVTANDLALKQSGYSMSELKKKTIMDLDPLYKDLSILQHLWKSLRPNNPMTIESRYQRKDKTIYPVEITITKIELNDQYYIIGFVREISERKKIEQHLIESEERHKIISTLSSDYIYSVDLKNLNLDWVSGAFKKITGYTAKEINKLPNKWNDVIHTENRKQSAAFFKKQIKNKKASSIDLRIIRKDGKVRWVNDKYLAIYDNNKAIRLFGSVRDITIQKQAEQTLRESEKKYRQLIDQSGDAIYLLYKNKFELVNKKFQEVFGVSQTEVSKPTFNFMRMVAPKSKEFIEERNRKYLKNEKPESNYQFKAMTAKGKEILIDASVSYVEYKDGWATQGVLRDITYSKHMEEQLRQSQKMEAVGQLAGGIAHDFNNLLTIINGYCDILQLKELQPEIRKPIGAIKEASNRAVSLTSQLLAFSRKQVIQPTMLNINEVLRNQIKMLQRLIGKDIEIVSKSMDGLGKVKADIGQIEQIIMNIAINSRDAMPKGGKLTIKTENIHFAKDDADKVPEIKPGNYVAIRIADTGIGMDDSTSARVFEPFFTTKERDKGTGLGLATVYGIVKQNKGYVYVNSELKKGTTFNIYLPAVKGPLKKQEKQLVQIKNLRGNETVLLVEDEDTVRDITYTNLESYGYKVLKAVNGKEALRIYNENKDDIDLVLTDIIMPIISGKELAEKLFAINPKIKIIFFSGYTDASILDISALDSGIEFIQKPYSHTVLADKIKKVLNKKS